MTGPHNTPAPKPKAATLDSRTSQVRIALIAAFVATCLFFTLFFVSVALQHRLQEGQPSPPVWFFLLGFAFLLAPYIISWFLLSNREQERIAAGAGVACGFFGAFVLVSPYAFAVTFLFGARSVWGGAPDRVMQAAALTLLVYMVISLWIVWSAFRIGKVQWSTFGAGVGATAFYLFVGFELLLAAGNQAQQQAEHKRVQANMDQNKPAMLAGQTIVSLAACLLRNHMLHPEADYPATLIPHPADWACDTNFAANAVPGFTLEYEPQKDAATGRVTDFQLTAMPDKKGIRGRDPLMIDSRGIVFVDYPWEMENVTPKVMVHAERLCLTRRSMP